MLTKPLRDPGGNARLAYCLNSVLNVKVVVAALNQDKALVGAFSMITNLRMELFEALTPTHLVSLPEPLVPGGHAGLHPGGALGGVHQRLDIQLRHHLHLVLSNHRRASSSWTNEGRVLRSRDPPARCPRRTCWRGAGWACRAPGGGPAVPAAQPSTLIDARCNIKHCNLIAFRYLNNNWMVAYLKLM